VQAGRQGSDHPMNGRVQSAAGRRRVFLVLSDWFVLVLPHAHVNLYNGSYDCMGMSGEFVCDLVNVPPSRPAKGYATDCFPTFKKVYQQLWHGLPHTICYEDAIDLT
jgi:hypothetical protein